MARLYDILTLGSDGQLKLLEAVSTLNAALARGQKTCGALARRISNLQPYHGSHLSLPSRKRTSVNLTNK